MARPIGSVTKVDSSVWRAKMRQMRQRDLPVAGREALMEMAHFVALGWFQRTPRDTNRMVAAIAQANNAAGLKTMPVPKLKQSKFSQNIRDQILEDVRESEAILKLWMPRLKNEEEKYRDFLVRLAAGQTKRRPGSRGKWRSLRDKEAIVKGAIKRLDDALEQLATLDALPEGAVFGARNVDIGFLKGSGFRGFGSKRQQSDKARIATRVRAAKSFNVKIIPEAFGGTGRVYQAGDQWFAEFTVREPHARIVERKTRALTRSLALARRAGVRRAGRRWVESLQRQGTIHRQWKKAA